MLENKSGFFSEHSDKSYSDNAKEQSHSVKIATS